MKRVKSVLKTLIEHGIVFYGVMVVLVIAALTSYGFMNKKSAEAAVPVADLTGTTSSNSTLLTVSGGTTFPIDSGYGAAESMAADDNGNFYVVLTPSGGNSDNSGTNLIKSYRLTASGGFVWNLNDFSYKLGHGNGATYDNDNKELLVATTISGDDKKGEVVRLGVANDATLTYKGRFYQTDSGGNKRVVSGIAYNKSQKRVLTFRNKTNTDLSYNTGYIDSLDANRTHTAYLQEKHSKNLTNQDSAYYDGYFYRLTWDKNGTAGFNANAAVIFQLSGWYGNSSSSYKSYYTNTACEIESMVFYNNEPYILFNNCSYGTQASKYFWIGKVTKVGNSTDLKRNLYHKFKINYNPNGGTWANGSSTSVVKDAIVGVPQSVYSDQQPTKTNKYFLGWSTSATATTAAYRSGDEYVKAYGSSDSDVTLYAVYEDYYTVSYNANGGSGAPSAQTQRKSLNVTIPTTKPTRTYYTFKGWATSSGGSVVYNPGDTYTNHVSVTLYAVWAPIQFKVTYYPNGGSGSSWSTTFNAADSVAISTTKPTRAYYTFKGWSTSASSSTIAYTGNGYETFAGHTNLNLYAVWEVQNYTISFNANGGSGAPSAITKPKTESPINLPANAPTRSGHTFKGWATTSTGAVAYQPSGSYSGRENTTLYAVWEEIVTPPADTIYYLSFDANGGDGGPGTVEVRNSIQAIIPAGEPTRDGFAFGGWSESTSGSGATYREGDSIGISGDKVLYAKWTVAEIRIDYNANGGSGAPARQSGAVGSLTISTAIPTRSGYTFDGWAERGGDSVEYRPGQAYLGNRSITLYAVWSENTIGVNFDLKGGNNGPGRISAAPNHTVVIPETTPKRDGYGFLGWSILSSALIVDYYPGDEIDLDDAEITLYAVWSENQYTVSFDANGGVGAPTPITGAGYRFVIPRANLGRTGYLFVGWNRNPEATEPEFVAGDIYTEGRDITLYAVWKEEAPESSDEGSDGDDEEQPIDDDDKDDDKKQDDEPKPAPGGSDGANTPNTEATNIFGLSAVLVLTLTCSALLVLKEKARRR